MNGLLIDKYYPLSIDDTIIDKEIIKNLRAYSKIDMPHLIINGPHGSCKKTLIDLFLKDKYKDKYIKKTGIVELKTKSSKKIEIKIIRSKYHIHINPSIHGVHDRLIIQEFINDVIKNQNDEFLIIVIEDADKLASDAQESLRRTIEKYICNCRFIFIQNSNSNIITPLNSRSVKITLGSPKYEDIFKLLKNIALKENININDDTINTIINLSKRNLKSALNYLDIYRLENKIIDPSIESIENIIYIYKTYNMNIINCIPLFRDNINTLLTHCIDPIDICKKIFNTVINDIDHKYIPLVIKEYTQCCDNLNIKNYNKPTYHIEQFVMYIYVYIYSKHKS